MSIFKFKKNTKISFNGVDVSCFEEDETIENPTPVMIKSLGDSIVEVDVEEDTENDPDFDLE